MLENTGKNIQSKIQTGHNQLRTYLHSDRLVNSSGHIKKDMNTYLKSIATENLPISPVKLLTTHVIAHDTLIVTSIPRKLILADTATRKGKKFQLSLTYDFDKFIKPLLPDQVFDQYLIIQDDKVLYETFFSGQTPFRDSLFLNRGSLKAASVVDREYAGTLYKLFILPVNLNADIRVFVVGLITSEHYSQSKTRLPPRFILLLITLFTCILVTFPIVKLYQLREEDRLTLKDAVSVTVVSMFLMSLIFLCFIKYSSAHSNNKDFAKLRLADSMSAAFVKEIKESYIKLDTLNSWIEHKPKFRNDFYRLGKHMNANLVDSLELCLIDSTVKGLDLDRIFWMGKNGVEFRTWTSGNKGFLPGRFDQRDYFKNIKSQHYYSLDDLPKSQFYVDQIVSWISGEFLTVIAKPSAYDSASVAAILFKPKSLKKAKIPPGYAFAMIDYNGRVLYHSDTTKNLNENLFEEFSDEKNLQASIKTGAFLPFKTHYYGKEYDVQIRPVGSGLPYYLVILESLIFEEYRDVNVYSFTLSMQLLLFILIVFQALAIFLASARPSLYKGRSFETSWLGPKSTSRKQYLFSALFNLLQLVIVYFLFTNETVLCRLFMLLTSILLMPVFLNFLFYCKYKNEKGLSILKIRAVVVGLMFTCFADFIAYSVLAYSFDTLLVFQFIAIGLGIVVGILHALVSDDIELKLIVCYKKAYTAMLISWMLVAMGLPVLIFFRTAYDYDQHLIARYTQLEFAEANAGEPAHLFKSKGNTWLSQPQKNDLTTSFYKDNYWVDSVWISESKPTAATDDTLSINLLKSLHLYSNENIPDRIHLHNPSAFDFSFFFNNLIRQTPEEKSASLTFYRIVKGNYLIIRSAALHSQLPSLVSFRGRFSWLVFVMTLAGFCVMVFGLIRRIFSLNMSDMVKPDPFDFDAWLLKDNAVRTFLIGLDDKAFNRLVPELSAKSEPLLLDLAKMPLDTKVGPVNQWDLKVAAAFTIPLKTVVIEHFEHNFKNAATNNGKMLLLEKLIGADPKRKILIRSSIHPSVLLAAFSSPVDKESALQTPERWNQTLRGFEIIVNPIPESFILENIVPKQAQMLKAQVLDSSTRYYHMYFSLWQSLSDEEKFLLYDLAEDDLVNTYDKNACALLIKKGIIKVKDGKLKFFSKGFRSFILSGLNPGELSGIIAKINDNANWNRIRMPLILISLAILIFILSSQRETSVKLLTTLGALATAIPALINLLSSVSGNGSKKAAS